jgi:hypothetical protein
LFFKGGIRMSVNDVFEEIKKVDHYIYHYTSLQNGLEYILPTMKLRLSPLTDMNDPRESKPLILSIPDIGKHIKDGDEKPLEAATLTSVFLKNFQIEHKAVCFSRDSNDVFSVLDKFKSIYRGYNKPTLWAHYADNHKGMCLIFNKDKLLDATKKEFGTLKNHYLYSENIVKYDSLENIISIFSIKFDDFLRLGSQKWLRGFYLKNYSELLFTKTLDWNAENEFRIVIKGKRKKEYLFLPINDSLCGIVLGYDFPMAYLKLVESYKIPCGKMGWFSGIPYIHFRIV